MRLFGFAIIAMFIASTAYTQPPGGGRGPRSDGGGENRGKGNWGGGEGGGRSKGNWGGGEGGGRGGMMMGGNPDEAFNMFSKGKDVIVRADLEGFQQMIFDRMAQGLNVTNGQITRDQFKQAAEQFSSRMRERGMGGMGGGPPGGGGGGRAGGGDPDAMNRFTEERFRQSDKNGDGELQVEEMSDALKSEREKWDTNKNGFIDSNEYKAYVQARFESRNADRPESKPSAGNTPIITSGDDPELEPDRRPTVFRAGKLPKELPAWFVQLDVDQDGQVGLYEWVKGSKAVAEFRDMDSNDDGFLIAEEVMRFVKDGKSLNYNVASNGALNGESSFRDPAVFGGSSRIGGNRPGRGDASSKGDGKRGPDASSGKSDSGNPTSGRFGGGDRGRGPGAFPGAGGNGPGSRRRDGNNSNNSSEKKDEKKDRPANGRAG